jgi:hypothetical protein
MRHRHSLNAESASVGARSTGSNGTAKLVGSAGASGLLEPRNELLNGELLGEGSTRVRAGSGGRGGGGGLLNGGGRRDRGSGGSGGRGSSRAGRGSGSAGLGGGGGVATGATAHAEVDAGLVGLVDGGSIPEPLDDAVTSLGALAADIGHGDVELGPLGVGRDGARGQSVLVPADEGLANDLVGADLDDGNVGNTVVGSADLNLHGDDLTGSVGEDLAGIREGNTLAVPHPAVGVVTLEVLEGTLDVAEVVTVLLVVDLVTADLLKTLAGHTGSGRGNVSVGSDGGDEASKGNSSGVGLHFEFWCLERASGGCRESD